MFDASSMTLACAVCSLHSPLACLLVFPHPRSTDNVCLPTIIYQRCQTRQGDSSQLHLLVGKALVPMMLSTIEMDTRTTVKMRIFKQEEYGYVN
ncbi:hypothetical protein BDR04DRAFT_1091870 [Suillus decipiens]|nr:hypothetical protein BDR04DRAFT_1091870 [Suillus decipiens]